MAHTDKVEKEMDAAVTAAIVANSATGTVGWQLIEDIRGQFKDKLERARLLDELAASSHTFTNIDLSNSSSLTNSMKGGRGNSVSGGNACQVGSTQDTGPSPFSLGEGAPYAFIHPQGVAMQGSGAAHHVQPPTGPWWHPPVHPAYFAGNGTAHPAYVATHGNGAAHPAYVATHGNGAAHPAYVATHGNGAAHPAYFATHGNGAAHPAYVATHGNGAAHPAYFAMQGNGAAHPAYVATHGAAHPAYVATHPTYFATHNGAAHGTLPANKTPGATTLGCLDGKPRTTGLKRPATVLVDGDKLTKRRLAVNLSAGTTTGLQDGKSISLAVRPATNPFAVTKPPTATTLGDVGKRQPQVHPLVTNRGNHLAKMPPSLVKKSTGIAIGGSGGGCAGFVSKGIPPGAPRIKYTGGTNGADGSNSTLWERYDKDAGDEKAPNSRGCVSPETTVTQHRRPSHPCRRLSSLVAARAKVLAQSELARSYHTREMALRNLVGQNKALRDTVSDLRTQLARKDDKCKKLQAKLAELHQEMLGQQ